MIEKARDARGDTGLIAVWAVLIAVTVLSAAAVQTILGLAGETALAVSVMTLGFIKACLVMWTFMEAKSAPALIKGLALGWTVIVWAVVSAMLVLG